MKIKAIARSSRRDTEASRTAMDRRNLDPKLHPFAEAREYTRAVVAAKLDRMMAKPFVCALDAHRDGVTCLACPRYEGAIGRAASGSGDGEVKVSAEIMYSLRPGHGFS